MVDVKSIMCKLPMVLNTNHRDYMYCKNMYLFLVNYGGVAIALEGVKGHVREKSSWPLQQGLESCIVGEIT